jgi:hypothetical protein
MKIIVTLFIIYVESRKLKSGTLYIVFHKNKKILDKKKKVVKLWHAIHTKYEKIDFRFPSHSPSLWAM